MNGSSTSPLRSIKPLQEIIAPLFMAISLVTHRFKRSSLRLAPCMPRTSCCTCRRLPSRLPDTTACPRGPMIHSPTGPRQVWLRPPLEPLAVALHLSRRLLPPAILTACPAIRPFLLMRPRPCHQGLALSQHWLRMRVPQPLSQLPLRFQRLPALGLKCPSSMLHKPFPLALILGIMSLLLPPALLHLCFPPMTALRLVHLPPSLRTPFHLVFHH